MTVPEILWVMWLVVALAGFASLEIWALMSHKRGDTLSERLRQWFQIENDGQWVKAERIGLGVLLVFMLIGIWLPGHIFNWWP